MADVSINTVTKLLLDVGTACEQYQDKALRNLPCKRIQCDEIWSFVHSKQRNVTEEQRRKHGWGDIWTWTAICADTKLVPTWRVGNRGPAVARAFISDLADRLAHRVQLTTDGHGAYLQAVEHAFAGEIDFAQLVKLYSGAQDEVRYSPAVCVGARRVVITGDPDEAHISTSYAERQNLTMRMQMRRFTRLTNAFSKKVANHRAAIALHFMHYNFARIHKTLRVTPAMEAGIADHVWSAQEIAGLLEGDQHARPSASGSATA
jgi:IS1 family transposase